MTLRGSAPTSIHLLAPRTCWDPLGRAGTPGTGWGCFHAPEVVPWEGSRAGVTAAAAGGCGKPPRCAARMPQTKGAGQDPARLAPAASVSSDRAVAAQPGCPREPCAPRTAGRPGGCPPRPPAAGAAPPQPASPGTPHGPDFLGKVPSGDTRLRRVPLAWFCRPVMSQRGPARLSWGVLSAGVSSRGVPSPKCWRAVGQLVQGQSYPGPAVVLGFGVLEWKLGEE